MMLMLYRRFGGSRRAGGYKVFEASLTDSLHYMIVDSAARRCQWILDAGADAAQLCLLQLLCRLLLLLLLLDIVASGHQARLQW